MRELFLEMVATLELVKEGYTVSDYSDTLNSNLSKVGFGKRSLFYLVFVLKIICITNHILSPARLSRKVVCYCSILHV